MTTRPHNDAIILT